MLFAVVNSEDMEDMVEEWIVENELDGDEDRWDEEEWGFYDELSLKALDEGIFIDVEETGIETVITSKSKFFDKFFDYASRQVDVYFNENGNEVSMKDWIELVKSTNECVISICECSPNT